MHIGQSISLHQKSSRIAKGEGKLAHVKRETSVTEIVRNFHRTFLRLQYCRRAPQHSGAAQYGCTWHELNFCPLVWVKQQICSCIYMPRLMHTVETHILRALLYRQYVEYIEIRGSGCTSIIISTKLSYDHTEGNTPERHVHTRYRQHETKGRIARSLQMQVILLQCRIVDYKSLHASPTQCTADVKTWGTGSINSYLSSWYAQNFMTEYNTP